MSDTQPTDETRTIRARALAHAQGRPGYPADAVKWLVPGQHKHVLEIGAGTGKLTEQVVAAGHAVHAVDREPVMLEQLLTRLPNVRVSEGSVEELEIAHRSVDTVLCSTAFTTFDHEAALPVIAKALKTGGHLSVVWHERDTRIPWVRRLGAFLEGPLGARDNEPRSESIVETLLHSPLFSFVEEESFTVWQDVNRDTVGDLVRSRSWFSNLDAAAQDAAVAEVQAFYADYGRGMDGMQLPYTVRCVRTQVVHQPGLFDDGTDVLARLRKDGDEASETAGEGEDQHSPSYELSGSDGLEATTERRASATGEAAPRTRYDQDLFRSDGTDTDMLLIDFR